MSGPLLELRFRLPERALSSVAVDDEVVARFTAIEQTRTAKVTRISPSVDPQTRTVELFATLDNPDGSLKSGMLAEVTMADAAGAAPPAAAKAAATPAAAKAAATTPAAPAAGAATSAGTPTPEAAP